MSKSDQVLAILSEISGMTNAEIKPEMDLVADLGIDSPKALRLLVELEDTLEIEISDEDAARMTTVGDILGHLGSLPSQGPS